MTGAPRSGGRTAEPTSKGRRRPAGGAPSGGTTGGGGRGARRYPATGATQGNAALNLAEQDLNSGPAERETAAAPRLRVAPPAPINAPRAPFIALVVAVVVAGVIGILLINTKTAENSFRIDTLQKRQKKLDLQQQELENKIAANNSPGSLYAAARKQGLVKAENPAYIRLPDGKIILVPRPATGNVSVTAQDAAVPPATGR
jgi:hypothetical protein